MTTATERAVSAAMDRIILKLRREREQSEDSDGR
jgi:hypothetical protein